jgi:hypothetical protein
MKIYMSKELRRIASGKSVAEKIALQCDCSVCNWKTWSLVL